MLDTNNYEVTGKSLREAEEFLKKGGHEDIIMWLQFCLDESINTDYFDLIENLIRNYGQSN